MAQNRTNTVMSASALIASAVALIRSGSTVSASGSVTLDKATQDLLIAIAAASGESLDAVKAILAQMQGSGAITIKGYPSNFSSGIIGRITFSQANRAYRLPAINIPDDVHLVIKAWPANGGLIYVGFSDVAVTTQLEQAYPLLPNEFVGYRVKVGSALYVSGNTVGDSVLYTAEQGG
jgi:hypothetical protein